MRGFTKTLLAGVFGLALAGSAMAQADKPLTILEFVPGPEFPLLRSHDEPDEGRGRGARQHHRHRERRAGQHAEADRRCRDCDHPGRRRHRHQPARSRRHGAGAAAGGRCRHPVVTIDRRVDKVPGILAHVGADNVKGGEAQGELIMKLFPDGANDHQPAGHARRQPGHRPQQGPAQRARRACRQVQVRLRADRELPPCGRPVGHRVGAWRHGHAAGSHRRRQRRHDLSARSRR